MDRKCWIMSFSKILPEKTKDTLCCLIVQEDKRFGFTASERRTSGNHWLIFSIIWSDVNPAKVDRLRTRDPLKENHRSSGVLEAWPLQPNWVLTPSMALMVITQSVLVTVPEGQFKYQQVIGGPILTEPRLCHQSHSTSRIFSGRRSINFRLHNWFTPTEQKTTQRFFSPYFQLSSSLSDWKRSQD